MASPTIECTFYDFNAVYYVLVSLLIVNSHWYYVFNSHIFCPTINREDSCTMGLFVLPVFCFLFVVVVCVLFRKCLDTLLKLSSKHQLRKLRLEFIKFIKS